MTDARKPYEANWPNGFETRDRQKVEQARHIEPGRLAWKTQDGRFFETAMDGGADNRALTIFCTPAPVVERLERLERLVTVDPQGNVRNQHLDANSAGQEIARCPDLRIVRLREVRPGDMTAEEAEARMDDARAVFAKAARWAEVAHISCMGSGPKQALGETLAALHQFLRSAVAASRGDA